MFILYCLVLLNSVLSKPGARCKPGVRCSSVIRAFAHGAMGRRIDHSWGEPTELFLVPASAPRLV